VEYLEAARAEGAALIVAINSEASARGLGKGPGRPWVTEQDRARVLAGLAAVDCVVVFDEPTPDRVLEALRPDLLVKGGDYTRDTIVGADLVESWGGRVMALPFHADHSTSSLLERLRATH
jgi:rfaE bifunctional protein nucleotidyltransferase chain/domain